MCRKRERLIGGLVCASILLIVIGTLPVMAELVIPGADGSDGAFSPTQSIEIDLSQAVTGTWDQPSPQPGKGIYDPEKWAIVFKYSSVNISSGVTVTFKNHPSFAPVVWLVSGPVTISGNVYLNGQNYMDVPDKRLSNPGPGGFRGGFNRGGSSSNCSAGFGPGGGKLQDVSGGSYATAGFGMATSSTYGNRRILPLIGGSGGSGNNSNQSGGAGGGAILIACQKTFRLSGTVQANGGDAYYAAGGSGGAIRIVSESTEGNGRLCALGGMRIYGGYRTGGDGRICVETKQHALSSTGEPSYVLIDLNTTPVMIWPDEAAPKVWVESLGGQDVPLDPRTPLIFPNADVSLSTEGQNTAVIKAKNVPVDGSWGVRLRAVPVSGADSIVEAQFKSGDISESTWEASVTLGQGHTVLQARAYKK